MRKPKVSQGPWYRCSDIWKAEANREDDVFIAQQEIYGEPVDHYRIFVNGKPLNRTTYFGESAAHVVAMHAGDMVHWSCQPTAADLYLYTKEVVEEWK